jgi:two-component system, NtrC family, response regulator GlrR
MNTTDIAATRILVAEDDRINRALLDRFARALNNAVVRFVEDGQEALQMVRAAEADILVTDLRMPLLSGEELFQAVRTEFPSTPVVIMTGYGSIEEAVAYLKRGAHDYLTKPFTEEVFIHRMHRIVEQQRLTNEVRILRETLGDSPLDRIVGQSPPMLRFKQTLPTLARSDVSILIEGESGTGKEVVARTLHDLSLRSKKPFVSVNCGALPETLLESELFGHKKGAFTDARTDSPGLVRSADGGTLFLDEIGEISLAVQVKLLRFLELKEYRPVGETQSLIADVRIIAATNRNLKEAVQNRSFREDLYYRLAVVPLTLPPLRERTGDVTRLAHLFLTRIQNRSGRMVLTDPSLFRKLESYRWPGNIRELENKIEQLVVLSQPEHPIRAEDVDFASTALPTPSHEEPLSDASAPFRTEKEELLARFERAYLTALLTQTRGHMTQAASRAGMDRKNLWQLMKRHDIRAERFRA